MARGYKEFYKTPSSDEEYDTAWKRLMQKDAVFGLAGKVDGRLVGIAHFLFHTSVCKQGARRYYWLTHEGNAVARALYDKVGKYNVSSAMTSLLSRKKIHRKVRHEN